MLMFAMYHKYMSSTIPKQILVVDLQKEEILKNLIFLATSSYTSDEETPFRKENLVL